MEVVYSTINWFYKRGLDKADPSKQLLKLIEEQGELAAGIARNDRDMIIDAIGDMQVVLIGYMVQTNLDIREVFYGIYKDNYSTSFSHELPNLFKISKCIYDLTKHTGELSQRNTIHALLTYLLDIAVNHGTHAEDCLKAAYEEIKDRKGKVVNGVFVKDEDLKDNNEDS